MLLLRGDWQEVVGDAIRVKTPGSGPYIENKREGVGAWMVTMETTTIAKPLL